MPGALTQVGMRRVAGAVKLLVGILFLAAAQAHGEVYTWKDSRGVDHYANRKDDIPVRYRSAAKSMEYDREPKAAGLPSANQGASRSGQPEARKSDLKEQGTSRTRKRNTQRDEED